MPWHTPLGGISLVPKTPPSHEEKWSGEPGQISWPSVWFCDSVTQQPSKHFVETPFKNKF